MRTTGRISFVGVILMMTVTGLAGTGHAGDGADTEVLPLHRRSETQRWDGLDELFVTRRSAWRPRAPRPSYTAQHLPDTVAPLRAQEASQRLVFTDALTGAEKWYLGAVADADVQPAPYSAFSSDGAMLLVRKNDGSAYYFDLRTMRAASEAPPTILSPVWDRVRAGILYGHLPGAGGRGGRIVRYDFSTGDKEPLAEAGGRVVMLTPSDDGGRLLWREGDSVLVRAGTDGSNVRRTAVAGVIDTASFLRDGSGRALVQYGDGRAELLDLAGDGGAQDVQAPAGRVSLGPGGKALIGGQWLWTPGDPEQEPQRLPFRAPGGPSAAALDSFRDGVALAYYGSLADGSDPVDLFVSAGFRGDIVRIDMHSGEATTLGGVNDLHPRAAGNRRSRFLSASPDGTKVAYLSTMLRDVGFYVLVADRPQAPEAVQVDGERLQWRAPENAREVKGYMVYSRTAPDAPGRWLTTEPVEATGYAIGAEAADDASYHVVPVEWSGLAGRPGVGFAAPGSPRSVRVAQTGDGHIVLEWAPPRDAAARPVSHYHVYSGRRADFAPGPAHRIGSPRAPDTFWQDTGLGPGQEVFYAVTAVGYDGSESEASPVLAARTEPYHNYPVLEVVQGDEAPVMDGRLDEPVWRAAASTGEFKDRYGHPIGPDSPFECLAKTTARVFQKDDMVYVGLSYEIEAEEYDRRSQARRRQRMPRHYRVGVHMTPGPGYTMIVCEEDGLSGGPEQSALQIADDVWTLELALPLSDLPEPIPDTAALSISFRLDGIFHEDPHALWRGKLSGLRGRNVRPQQPGFVREPAAEPDGDGALIRFEVDGLTDVAVWIEDGDGRTVRHLAAGVLGADAPEPLQKNSLSQELYWDGTCDFGEALPPDGDCTVRVGLGVRPRLDRVIGTGIALGGSVHATGVGPGGELYVHTSHSIGHGHAPATRLRVFDRYGHYSRNIIPAPADIPAERLTGRDVVETASGETVRFGANLVVSPERSIAHNLSFTGSGQVVYIGSEGDMPRFEKINPDGSIPEDWRGPDIQSLGWREWQGLGRSWIRIHSAMSADDRAVYFTGLHRSNPGRLPRGASMTVLVDHVVYRAEWDRSGAPVVFAGQYRRAGDDDRHFNDPQGLDIDARGNVWVADRGNDRIVVLDSTGRYRRSFPAPRPEQVFVGGRTGESYVLGVSGDGQGGSRHTLRRYASDGTPDGEPLDLGELARERSVSMDALGDAAVFWIAHPDGELVRVSDEGGGFSMPRTAVPAGDPFVPTHISVGWESDIVGRGRHHWYDGRTGELYEPYVGVARGSGGFSETFGGRDGRWYTFGGYYKEAVTVFDEDFNRIRSFQLVPPSMGRAGMRGFTVSPAGDIYVLRYYNFTPSPGAHGPKGPEAFVAMDVYSPEGEMKYQRLIEELSPAAHAPAVDIHGNIYICDNFGRRIGKEHLYEQDLPDEVLRRLQPYDDIDFDRLARGEPQYRGVHDMVFGCPLIRWVGYVMKFGPQGGALAVRGGFDEHDTPQPQVGEDGRLRWGDGGFEPAQAPEGPPTHFCPRGWGLRAGLYPFRQKGVQWEWLGVAPSPSQAMPGGGGCICPNSRIAVDDFGRVYVPAAHRSAIQILDSSANPVTRFGGYANEDSFGAPGLAVGPGIPLLYPTSVALSRRAVYVGDAHGGRILRVVLDYDRQAAVKVGIGR